MNNTLKQLALLLAFLVSAQLWAEDTLKINALDKVDMTWWGNDTAAVTFPDGAETYRQINMLYTLSCPTVGCNRFDYTVKIEVWKKDSNGQTQRYEMFRGMTPYGSNLPNSFASTFTVDVTDYAPILQGEATVVAFFGGYPDDGKWWVATVDFHFIKGTPPRPVLSADILYRSGPGGFKYGDANDPIESHLINTTFTKHADAKSAMVRMVASGHGFGNSTGGNPENCAEFCAKNFYVNVNGTVRYATEVWRNDCGANPIFNQGGTWIYNRAGWCPGLETMRYDHEIGDYIGTGTSFDIDIDWDVYTYTGGSGFPINYIIDAHVFQYGDYSHDVDAAISAILSPNTDLLNSKTNPICSNPVVVLRNLGKNALNNCEIVFGTRGSSTTYSHFWSGNLAYGESDTVVLASNGKLFAEATTTIFEVEVRTPNNTTDEEPANNKLTAAYQAVDVYPTEVMIWGNTNAAAENSMILLDDQGFEVWNSGLLPASRVIRDTLVLADGCYTLRIEDTDCDGLSFFNFNGDGAGSMRLHRADGSLDLLHNFPAGFGCFAEVSFAVGSGYSGPEPIKTNVDNQHLSNAIRVYPNPAHDRMYFDFNALNQQVVQMQFWSIDGSLVQTIENVQPLHTIDVLSWSAGIYLAILNLANGKVLTKKITVE